VGSGWAQREVEPRRGWHDEMSTCFEVEPLLASFSDGSAGDAEHRQVSAHLADCLACRANVAAQQSSRRVLQERGSRLVPGASPELRARCASALRSDRQPSWKSPVRRTSLLALAATLFLAAAMVVLYGATGRSAAVLAAQLALDHVKCFTFFEPAGSEPADPRLLEAQIERVHGWHAVVPDGSPSRELVLLGARRCLYGEGPVAHIMYRQAGLPVSLFVLPDARRAPATVSVLGHAVLIRSSGGSTYIVVARTTPDGLQEVADYVMAAIR
jgi:anti-sigma factor RsiW